MDIFDYDIINEIYNDLKREQSIYKKDLEDKKKKIDEINNYLTGLLDKDQNEAQVFLARKIESLYREDIERGRREKEKISIECDSLEKYIHALDFKILKLKKVLSVNSSMLHVKHLLGPSSIDLLNDVIQKMKLISIRIDNDPDQAKIDLENIENDIYRVIENLKNV